MANSVKFIVEEEYGYKYWSWNIKGTKEEIMSIFDEMVTGVSSFYSGRDYRWQSNLGGDWERIEWEEFHARVENDDWDGYAHVHENHDSELVWRTV